MLEFFGKTRRKQSENVFDPLTWTFNRPGKGGEFNYVGRAGSLAPLLSASGFKYKNPSWKGSKPISSRLSIGTEAHRQRRAQSSFCCCEIGNVNRFCYRCLMDFPMGALGTYKCASPFKIPSALVGSRPTGTRNVLFGKCVFQTIVNGGKYKESPFWWHPSCARGGCQPPIKNQQYVF